MRMRRLMGAALALGLLLAGPHAASARAASASATVTDPAGDAVGTTDLLGLGVTWDGTTLTLTATFAAPTFGALDVLVSEAASLRDISRCAPDAADTATIAADPQRARLELDGLDAPLTADAAWAGSTVTFAFSSDALAGELVDRDPFACVSGSAAGDRFSGAFDGKVLRITPEAATDALAGVLAGRFGARFDRARRIWLACPRQQISPETRERHAAVFCRFEFLAGRRYHGGSVTLVLVAGAFVPARLRAEAYTKRTRRCEIAPTKGGLAKRLSLTGRTLRASRSFGRRCGRLAGPGGPAGALVRAAVERYPRAMPRRFTLNASGRGAAGFEAMLAFHCRIGKRGGRYTFKCRNELRDRFVYAVTLVQAPKPAPPPPPSDGGGGGGGCDPNYTGACLDPNASDYDCAGGSGDGPNYVQGPITVVGDDHYGLDSDGDGVACES
jgi:hypothetical protein